jgi:ribosomal protein S15P/S13E
VRLPQHHRDFLYNSYEGNFTNITQQEARDLLDTIANNIVACDLDKGNKSRFQYEYACVENFSTTVLFEELNNRFCVDPHVLVEVTKYFANHLNVPKKDLMFMLNLLKIMHMFLKLRNRLIKYHVSK